MKTHCDNIETLTTNPIIVEAPCHTQCRQKQQHNEQLTLALVGYNQNFPIVYPLQVKINFLFYHHILYFVQEFVGD